MMLNTIVIVSSQRSGSTWLMQVLAQVTGFRVYGEVFREITSEQFRGDPALKPPLFYTEHAGNVESYIETLRSDNKVVVVKLMYDQIVKNPELVRFLSKKNILVINLTRTNVFDISISKSIARATGVYHRENDDLDGSIYIKLRDLKVMMSKELIKNFVYPIFLKIISHNYYHYEYEKIVKDISLLESQLKENFNEFGLTLDSSLTKWKKTKTESKMTSIRNYNELVAGLEKGMFKRFLK